MSPSILVWNCRGANSTQLFSNIKDLVSIYKPNILVLVETRVHSQRVWPCLENLFFFAGIIDVDAVGFSGKIWVIWDYTIVDMEVLSVTDQSITSAVNGGVYVNCLLTAIYASPRRKDKEELWQYMGKLGQNITSP